MPSTHPADALHRDGSGGELTSQRDLRLLVLLQDVELVARAEGPVPRSLRHLQFRHRRGRRRAHLLLVAMT